MNENILKTHKYEKEDIILDTLAGLPTFMVGVDFIYPITINGYKKFREKWYKYIILSQEYLEVENEGEFLPKLILAVSFQVQAQKDYVERTCDGAFADNLVESANDVLSVFDKKKKVEKKEKKEKKEDIPINPPTQETIGEVIEEMIEMFQVFFRHPVTLSKTGQSFLIWVNEKTPMKIDSYNYELFRNIVMIQNGLKEPVHYKDEEVAKWMNKARMARQTKDIKLYDLIVLVKNKTNKSYEDIFKCNALQFHADYSFIIHEKHYDATILFKTVSDKVPNVDFTDNIIDILYQNDDEKLLTTTNKLMGQ